MRLDAVEIILCGKYFKRGKRVVVRGLALLTPSPSFPMEKVK